MRARYRLAYAAFAVAGVTLASIASRERSAEASSALTAPVVRAASLFGSLQACEVPGLHEHLLAKGTHTQVYAGEFTPTRATPWTTGNARIFVYVVSGSGLVRIGNASTKARPGDFFVIPKGARHAVSATTGTLRAIYFEDRT